MASVWVATAEDKTSRKIIGGASFNDAKRMVQALAMQFEKSNPAKRKSVKISDIEYHSAEGGKIVGHLWVEPISPPSAPIGGDIYRTRKGAK